MYGKRKWLRHARVFHILFCKEERIANRIFLGAIALNSLLKRCIAFVSRFLLGTSVAILVNVEPSPWWYRTANSRGVIVSTWPLARPLARSLTRITDCLIRSARFARALHCANSFARWLPSSWESGYLMSHFQAVLNLSASQSQFWTNLQPVFSFLNRTFSPRSWLRSKLQWLSLTRSLLLNR